MRMKTALYSLALLALSWSLLSAAESWPEEGATAAIWVWGSAVQAEPIFDEDDNWLRDSEFRFRGLAHPDRHFAAVVDGGALEAVELAAALSQHWADQQQLHVEMALRPGSAADSGLLWAVAGDQQLPLALGLEKGRLSVVIGGDEEDKRVDLGPLPLTQARHLAFSFNAQELRWAVDGERQPAVALPSVPDLAGAQRVSFGGLVDGSQSWSGTMEGLLIAGAPRLSSSSASYWQAQWDSREALVHTRVKARLVAHASEPAAADLVEYDECLLAMVWEVEEHLDGPQLAAEQILTWHWYQLDRRVLEQARPPSLNSSMILELSPLDQNPQTSGVQMVETDLEPDQVFGLDAYLLVGDLPTRDPQEP